MAAEIRTPVHFAVEQLIHLGQFIARPPQLSHHNSIALHSCSTLAHRSSTLAHRYPSSARHSWSPVRHFAHTSRISCHISHHCSLLAPSHILPHHTTGDNSHHSDRPTKTPSRTSVIGDGSFFTRRRVVDRRRLSALVGGVRSAARRRFLRGSRFWSVLVVFRTLFGVV